MYHAFVVKESLELPDSIHKLSCPILSTKTGAWTLFKIEIDATRLDTSIASLQSLLKSTNPWYIHLYNEFGSELIVIFKEAIFRVNADKSSWEEAVKYGLSLGIPKEQLDFCPNKFNEEIF